MDTKPVISRTGVYGIAKREGKILLVKQRAGPYAGMWDLPGGGIEAKETIEEALRREFLEEVGMTFDAMSLFRNLTSIDEGFKDGSSPYILHRIGLIYEVEGVKLLQGIFNELTYEWMDLEKLAQSTKTPFVQKIFPK